MRPVATVALVLAAFAVTWLAGYGFAALARPKPPAEPAPCSASAEACRLGTMSECEFLRHLSANEARTYRGIVRANRGNLRPEHRIRLLARAAGAARESRRPCAGHP